MDINTCYPYTLSDIHKNTQISFYGRIYGWGPLWQSMIFWPLWLYGTWRGRTEPDEHTGKRVKVGHHCQGTSMSSKLPSTFNSISITSLETWFLFSSYINRLNNFKNSYFFTCIYMYMLCYACHVWVSVVCLWEMWNNLQQLVLSSHTWAPENSSCPISTKSIYLSHLTLLLKNTASEVKPKNSAYTCKCLKTTNRKTTAKKKTAEEHLSQMTSVNSHRFLHFPPQPYSHRQTVGVSPGTGENTHACLLTGKDKETAPFVSPQLMPYLCKPRFAPKPRGGRWAIKQFSKGFQMSHNHACSDSLWL